MKLPKTMDKKCCLCQVYHDDNFTGKGTKSDPLLLVGGGGSFQCSDLNDCDTDSLPEGSTNKYFTCQQVLDCLGISDGGDAGLLLNQQGDFVEASVVTDDTLTGNGTSGSPLRLPYKVYVANFGGSSLSPVLNQLGDTPSIAGAVGISPITVTNHAFTSGKTFVNIAIAPSSFVTDNIIAWQWKWIDDNTIQVYFTESDNLGSGIVEIVPPLFTITITVIN